MKTTIISLLFLFFQLIGLSQTWQPMGVDPKDELGWGMDYSNGMFQLGNKDSIFVGFSLLKANQSTNVNYVGALVKKYDGTRWVNTTTQFNDSFINNNNTFYYSTSMVMNRAKEVFFTSTKTSNPLLPKVKVVKYSNGVWSTVGLPNFDSMTTPTSTFPNTPRLGLGKGDTLHVLYTNPMGRLTMMKFNGNNWDSVGQRGFANGIAYVGWCFDTTGTPYISTNDPVFFNRLVVLKYASGNWVTVSPAGGLSNLSASNIVMTCNQNTNQLYVSYIDQAYPNNTWLMKYDGANWTTLMSNTVLPSTLRIGALKFSKQDTLLGLQMSPSNNNGIISKFIPGSGWVQMLPNFPSKLLPGTFPMFLKDSIPVFLEYLSNVGPYVFSFQNGSYSNPVGTYGIVNTTVPYYSSVTPYGPYPVGYFMSLAVSDAGTPYLAFADSSFNGRVSLLKYNGASWQYVGTPGFSTYPTDYVRLIKGIKDTVYIFYKQGYYWQLAHFDGNSFVTLPSGLSTTYPSGAYLDKTNFAFDTSGVPYVCYPDPANFNLVTVKKYVGGSWVSVNSIPTASEATIAFSKSNQLYAFYKPNSINGQLAVWQNNTWNLLGGLVDTGAFLLDRNDTPSLLAIHYTYIGGMGSKIIYGTVIKFINGAWTPSHIDSFGIGSWAGQQQVNFGFRLAFDTSNQPYVLSSAYYSATIWGRSQGKWKTVSNVSDGWTPSTFIANVDLACDKNNNLISAYGAFRTYALSYQIPSKPQPPSIANHFIKYCQKDTALALVASGQNLLWYYDTAKVGVTIPPIPSTKKAGTFKCYVTQSSGIYESDRDSITIVVYPNPKPKISSNGIILSVSNIYLSYQWKYNNNDIVGGTTNSLQPAVDGYYSVWVTDSNGCKGVSDTILISGLATIQTDGSIRAYPNPLSGNTVTIEADNLPQGDYQVQVFDAVGQRVWMSSISHQGGLGKWKISLKESLAQGAYLLILDSNGKKYRTILLKQ
ncbi:MAG: T9SS type A sorting domain-containing protein [Bacteroidetes bacterium]|nr:T9SS type A sorting domain-containing protein [Bacteroidota bacterium]